MTASNSSVFKFSDVEVLERELRATRAGNPIAIEPKAFRVLVYLLRNSGRLVTKDELLSAIWGDTAVTDNSLTRAIALLRRVLEDDPHQPHFIETVATIGYRFIATVETSATEAPPTAARITRVGFVSQSWWIALAAIVLVSCLVAALLGLNIAGLRDNLISSLHSASGRPGPQIKAIAVLPFEDVSNGPPQEYFADGMTEELITILASIKEIRVISRASVMQFKGTRKSLPEIARELNVDGIIEGTVARSGSHVRITANLLHAPTDRHLWAESYETDIEDVLNTQSNVAHSIADALRIELVPPRSSALARSRRVNPEAYDACLEGWYFMNKGNGAGFEKAAASFRRSIDLDPTYAPAYSGLAALYQALAIDGLRPATDVFPLTKAAAQKALELDDGLGEVHATEGFIKTAFAWDWAGAEAEFQRAIQVAPNSSLAHLDYGTFLAAMSRRDESVAEARKALELDPLNLQVNLQLAWILYYARRHDEAIAQLKRILELDPGFFFAYVELGWNYAQKGMYSEAALACHRAESLEPANEVMQGSCGMVLGLAGRRAEAIAFLARIKKVPERSYLDPYNVALLYAGLGDTNNTMVWLERAYREHSASLWALKVEILPDRVRADDRFQELLHRMNFPN